MPSEIKAAGIPELSHMKLMAESYPVTYTDTLKILLRFLPLLPILDNYFKEIIPQREENYTTKILLQSFLL